jgi:hypothetical protein
MTKVEAIAFGVAIIIFLFFKYDVFTDISKYLTYIFFILFLGSSIAPEIEPKAFHSPKLFQFGVGLVSGVLAAQAIHADKSTYLAVVSIFIYISILAPVWMKILEHA